MPRRTSAAAVSADVDTMIAETAYYKAEQRGFAPGHELSDWLTAEQEVHAILSGADQPAAKRARAATGSRAATSAAKKTRAKKSPPAP